ncbi:protoporphyrinogen oxidase [Candidatus Magnetoovum chiemensis]|nr:protoporphyrinogen oxidase [Candidatus Magnetoovum chiemensis]
MKIIIVGAGISGLSLAYILLKKIPSVQINILEQSSKAGGKISTDKEEGFLLESSVNGFLDNKPETLDLIAMLGINPMRSSDKAKKRYIYTKGKLSRVPESFGAFVKSDILSLSGKLRLALEPFIRRTAKDDETLAEFATRRLGKEAYETMIDPMATGIYAGDSNTLSLKSCFPKIENLEKTYGSLIKGMIKKKIENRKTGVKVTAGPGGTLTSFSSGMQTLIDSLSAYLGKSIKCSHKAQSLDKSNDNKYILHLENSLPLEADVIIFSTPSYSTAKILNAFDKPLSKALDTINFPPVTVCCTGFKEDALKKHFDGFGFLIPRKEKRKILGTLSDSNTFSYRAPEHHTLLRTMIGGACASNLAMQEDNKIKETVLTELDDIIGIKTDPVLFKIYRHEKAIPQYNKGHSELLKNINILLEKHQGLYLHGNSFGGISLNDCAANSFKLAYKIINDYKLSNH